jgi:hypothetical protein
MYTLNVVSHVDVGEAEWVEVDLSDLLQGSAILLQCRTAVNVKIAKSNDPGEDYFTIKSGQGLEISAGSLDNSSFYAKSSSGTVVLEIMEIRKQV